MQLLSPLCKSVNKKVIKKKKNDDIHKDCQGIFTANVVSEGANGSSPIEAN